MHPSLAFAASAGGRKSGLQARDRAHPAQHLHRPARISGSLSVRCPAQRTPGRDRTGSCLPTPGTGPYEESVEFMFAELPPGADRRMGLIVTTGYKAGLWMVFLPHEAYVSGRPWAVSASWLRDNWTADVYVESDTEKIQVRSDSSPSWQHALS
ncbi:Imm45 family immunity protein [Streptomyces sp. NPDC054874]